MAGFWERRAERKRIKAEHNRQLKIDTQAIKNAVKANEIAAKAFLANCKNTMSKNEYARIEAQCKRELKENKKWCKLELAATVVHRKHAKEFELMGVNPPGKESSFARRRVENLRKKFMDAADKTGGYLRTLEDGAANDLRRRQIDRHDLSSVSLAGFTPRTTIEEQRNILRQQLQPTVEVVAQENNAPVRERFVLDEAVAGDGGRAVGNNDGAVVRERVAENNGRAQQINNDREIGEGARQVTNDDEPVV